MSVISIIYLNIYIIHIYIFLHIQNNNVNAAIKKEQYLSISLAYFVLRDRTPQVRKLMYRSSYNMCAIYSDRSVGVGVRTHRPYPAECS